MFFFFQAEDGIRDVAVTGVQTCALPISAARHHASCQRRTNEFPYIIGAATLVGWPDAHPLLGVGAQRHWLAVPRRARSAHHLLRARRGSERRAVRLPMIAAIVEGTRRTSCNSAWRSRDDAWRPSHRHPALRTFASTTLLERRPSGNIIAKPSLMARWR